MPEPIHLSVNGDDRLLPVDPQRSLLSVIRDELGLIGAKVGCGEGECGACTVLVDDRPVRACVTRVGEVAGRRIETIEGLSAEGLHPIARAFVEEEAMQCGFCTAGMIVGATGLLRAIPDPTDAEIREHMQGNVCRCGTYPRIERAIRRAAATAHAATGGMPAELRGHGALEAGWMPRPPAPWDMTDPRERDYFSPLGDGLVVVLPPEEAARNHPDQPGPWHRNGGAWIHVGADEVVTAFTGKVDVGQDNRTALSLLVADELRMPLDAVRLVLGDTDVCPYDVGTFGSRSMPDAGEYLRAAAAAAREWLLGAAASRLAVDRSELSLSECRIATRDGARAVSVGTLLHGQRSIEMARMEAAGTPGAGSGGQVPGEAGAGRVPGKAGAAPVAGEAAGTRRVPRAAATDVVRGVRRYVSDVERPNMLHGKVLRPPAFGARLVSLDPSAAEAMPGVRVVREDDFVGVAAPSMPGAVRALAALRAEWTYEPGPSDDGIVGYLRAHPVEGRGWEGAFEETAGDVEAALASAPVRLDATYTAAYIAHVPLETRTAVAEWSDERLTVWTGTQRPFGVREQLAEALGIPEAQVRVIVPDTGGGYGGKHTGDAAVEAARLARAAGHPVKVRWSREEETTWAYFRPFAVIDVHSGADGAGMLRAWDFTNLDSGPNAIATPYEVPNRHIAFVPAASPLRTGSYRALAATANTFARESHMDELAHRVGADPLEYRLRHLRDERLRAVLVAAAERAGWGRDPEPGRGLGIACCREKWAYIATVADVRVAGDGRLELLRLVSAYEAGRIVDQGGLASQVEGSAVMALGGALFEAVRFEDGRILNAKLSGYRVPRFGDVPPIEVVLLDRPDVPSAGGGEVPLVAVAPAIANAVFAACGVRLRDLPLVPDGIVPGALVPR